MIRESLLIQNKLGLHTRAAAKLVDVAKGYAAKIELIFQERSVDAKSIMGVITLGAQKNQTVETLIQGEDEAQAFAAIKKLIDNKFGEE
jgi:phosphocarrier protein HPr